MDSPPLADAAARERARRDWGGALAVEAGAGTGKTTLLVDRVVHALAAGRIRAAELVAITFTRKAAGELRVRLRREVARALAAAEGETATHLRRARAELMLARVSTIHAFCRGILAAHPLEAGLDPGFVVEDEGLGGGLGTDVFDHWLVEILGDSRRGRTLTDLLSWGVEVDTLREVAWRVAAFPDARPAALPGKVGDDDDLWEYLVSSVRGFVARSARAVEGASNGFVEDLQALERRLEQVAVLPPEARTRWLLSLCEQGTARLAAVNRGGRKGELGAIKQEFKRWRDEEVPARLRRRFAPLVGRALGVLAEFQRWVADRRREAGCLSHDDLLLLTRDLLRDDREVRYRVRRQIRALLIDEFQDTDPLQAEILHLLMDADDPPDLFLVGDPKQSIYRFRRADVATYTEEVERLENRGAKVEITVNFRSTSGLLRVINEVGEEIFDPRQWSAGQAPWRALQAPAGKTGSGPALVLAPLEVEARASAEEVARAEARMVARELLRVHQEMGVEAREMAVLFPVSTRVDVLEQALADVGLPCRREKSQDFFHRVEVAELALVLGAVADPQSEELAVGALRTRLLALSDETLAAHRAAGGGFRPAAWLADCPPTDGVAAVNQALCDLAGWHRLAQELSPPDLLEHVLRQTRFLVLLELVPGGQRAAANVLKLLDRARAHWREGGYGVEDFVRWLWERTEKDEARESESPAAEDESRVSLLTIHGAKGLEWRVVALFATNHRQSGRRQPVLIDRHTRRVEASFSSFLVSGAYDALAQAEQEQARAERARLVYVALTRACERLILPSLPPDLSVAGGSFQQTLALSPTWSEWVESAAAGRDPAPPEVVTAPSAPPRPAPPPPVPASLDGVSASAMRQRWRQERARIVEQGSRLRMLAPSSLSCGSSEPQRGGGIRRGREIGKGLHRLLQWALDDDEGLGARSLEDLARRVGLDLNLDEAECGVIIAQARHALDTELLRRALERPRWCEWPVIFKGDPGRLGLEGAGGPGGSAGPGASAAAGEEVLVEGLIDLVFEEPEGLVVVDYKTDPWSDDAQRRALVARHAPQVGLYARLLEASGRRVAQSWLLFIGAAAAVAEEVTVSR